VRVIAQRVSNASVIVKGDRVGQIGYGLLLLVGFTNYDTVEDIIWITKKVVNLRIFDDEFQKMNLSLKEVADDILLISQFTLFASTKKGNRPSFIASAKSDKSKDLYLKTIIEIEKVLEKPIQTGVFGARMQVSLTNTGPTTIIIDSKNKE
jgi:D-tyrosyl-tRNA(Tyr) deacylase